jgi:hypothetical protein
MGKILNLHTTIYLLSVGLLWTVLGRTLRFTVQKRMPQFKLAMHLVHFIDRLCIPELGIVGVKGKGKGKAIPLQTWTGPEGSEGSGSQISRQSAHEGGKVVSPTHWLPLPHRKYYWYSFLLEPESTPGP